MLAAAGLGTRSHERFPAPQQYAVNRARITRLLTVTKPQRTRQRMADDDALAAAEHLDLGAQDLPHRARSGESGSGGRRSDRRRLESDAYRSPERVRRRMKTSSRITDVTTAPKSDEKSKRL